MGCAAGAASTPQISLEQREVESWLRDEVSMPEYIDVFISNGYDRFAAVYEINETHLRGMGVKLGHIKVIMRAIALKKGLVENEMVGAPPVYDQAPPSYEAVVPVDTNGVDSGNATSTISEDDKLAKYVKMKNIGIPQHSIISKMRLHGLSDDNIERFKNC